MSDDELYEALVERAVLHEFVSEVFLTVGNSENSKREAHISKLYLDMASLVYRFENVCLDG